MESNLKKGNKKYDDNNMAVNIAWREFEDRHPRESWPEWLTKCIRISGTKSPNNNWLIKITVLPKSELKPNQHWEEKNGIPVLVEVEPSTGKRRLVICGGPAVDVEVLFEAEIDLDNGSATVITDTDLELLDGTKYEFNNC
jgi:hypothetical protein